MLKETQSLAWMRMDNQLPIKMAIHVMNPALRACGQIWSSNITLSIFMQAERWRLDARPKEN